MQEEIRREIVILLMYEKFREAIALIDKNKPHKLYKYRAGNEKDIIALKEGKIWVSRADLLDDDDDGRVCLDDPNQARIKLEWMKTQDARFKDPKYEQAVNNISKETKCGTFICSLSEVDDNEFMWKNYADNERGICLEYDFEKLRQRTQYWLIPVSYSTKRPMKIEEFINVTRAKVMGLFSKYSIGFNDEKWYEQEEWRIAGYNKTFEIDESDKGRLVDAPMPEKIIFGKDASNSLKAEIQDWIKQENLNIQLEYK